MRTACEERHCQLKVDKVLKVDTNTRSTAECVVNSAIKGNINKSSKTSYVGMDYSHTNYVKWIMECGSFPVYNCAKYAHGINNVFDGMSLQAIMAIFGLSVLNIVAAISLLRLKKTALYIFLASLVINILLTLSTLITPEGRQAFFGLVIIGAVVDWIILCMICFYCNRLIKKQVLH